MKNINCHHLLNITALEVKLVLENLPLGKAVGPNGINNRVLRKLAGPLSLFYNLSLQNSKVPDDWKEAHVCPIHKGGDPVLVSNYRPVSLLNTLVKNFEKCIFKHIYNHFVIMISFHPYNLDLYWRFYC